MRAAAAVIGMLLAAAQDGAPEASCALTVTVRHGGERLGGVDLHLRGDPGASSHHEATDESGTARFERLPAGDLRLRAYGTTPDGDVTFPLVLTPSSVRLVAGQRMSADVDVVTEGMTRLRVTLRPPAGEDLVACCLFLTPSDDPAAAPVFLRFDDGDETVPSIRPGTYRIEGGIHAPCLYAPRPVDPPTIVVPAQPEHTVTVRMLPAD
jgi:hypothetical protein